MALRSVSGVAAKFAEVVRPRHTSPALWRGALPDFVSARKPKSQVIQTPRRDAHITWAWDIQELGDRLKDTGEDESAICEALLPRDDSENFISQWKSAKKSLKVADALKAVDKDRMRMQLRLDPALFWRVHERLPDFFYESQDSHEAFQVAFENSFVWVTTPGLRTSLHSDEDAGILFHLSGHKRVVLIPPSSSDRDPELLEQLMRYRWKAGSIEDLYTDEMEPKVDLIHVDLNPGDALYIPKRWLHDIESIDTTVSLAVRFYLKSEKNEQ
mmetsp:Transcript_20406/g.40133  ORF Transcript_20406/g.40133 Transcript_20406/m.40133 type:complete len:271 (-) Transcript_20406:1658-2470(-)|eukprot:CAMPEP_0171539090 /NCGR_PEP_ID=MMETSP0960-20121227/408_1 /TAXON_ID=87120 /ORGANISM="Aurantiochytrium limacinum, Strain ATCCMYA-1381" /LENGTH=270 /DNA_ID=CAMNT_0012086061 /DNA_START=235 /DNA_END=1047 /DNA_ORIENTATION=-